MRKVSKHFRELQEQRVKQNLPEVKNTEMVPLKQSLSNDLKEAASDAKKTLRLKQENLMKSLSLDEFAIKGTDEDWEKALPSGNLKVPSKISVKGKHKNGKSKDGDSKRSRSDKKSKSKNKKRKKVSS